jgi:putative membrane protein insertion efficiency factor
VSRAPRVCCTCCSPVQDPHNRSPPHLRAGTSCSKVHHTSVAHCISCLLDSSPTADERYHRYNSQFRQASGHQSGECVPGQGFRNSGMHKHPQELIPQAYSAMLSSLNSRCFERASRWQVSGIVCSKTEECRPSGVHGTSSDAANMSHSVPSANEDKMVLDVPEQVLELDHNIVLGERVSGAEVPTSKRARELDRLTRGGGAKANHEDRPFHEHHPLACTSHEAHMQPAKPQTDSLLVVSSQRGVEYNYMKDTEKLPKNEAAGVGMALALLRFYKREISPIMPPSCRFIPTCSEYAMDAFKKYGLCKGFVLTSWRLLRCNPFGVSTSVYGARKWS